MKTKKNYRNTALTLVAAVALGGLGVVTTAAASPRVANKVVGASFEPGAAERKADALPKAWRMSAKAISFDSMYAR